MMKQNLRFIFMALLCAVCSMAWGQTPEDLFHETFGNNPNSARDWNDGYSVKSGVEAVYSGITGYIVSNVKQGKNTTGSTKSGLNQSTQGTDAYIIIGPLNVANYNTLQLTYQWKAASINGTYSTTAYYATSANGQYSELTGTGDGATTFVERAYSLPNAAQVSTLYLKIVFNTSNTQAIIDEVNLSGKEGATSGPRDPDVSFGSSSVRVGVGATINNALTKPGDLTVTCTSSNPNVATYNPETDVVTGVAEGYATITISWDEVENVYNSGSISFDVTVSNSFIATFDFTGNDDYGSGVTVLSGSTQEYAEDATWTSGVVKLETTGRYRWYTSQGTKTLRFYKASGDDNAGSLTFSLTNSNYVITSIEFDSNVNLTTTTPGSFSGGVWTGICKEITFSHTDNSGSVNISSITITYGPAPTIPVNITNVGYATLYYGTKHLIVPEGVEAYTCEVIIVNTDKTITHTTTFVAGNVIPAGTAVLLKATTEVPETGREYIFTESVNAGDKEIGNNMLRGYDEAATTKGPNEATEGYRFYVLSLNANNDVSSVGFYYKNADGAAFESGAHKAYLAVPTSIAGASSYIFDENTGIKSMEAEKQFQEGVYTLSGVRMRSEQLPAGIYIVNGKKMVIK